MTGHSGRAEVFVVTNGEGDEAELVRALEADRDIVVVGRARGAQEAAGQVERLRPDVVIVDIPRAAAEGLDAVQAIMGRAPTPILVLVSRDQDGAIAPERAEAAIDAGALAGTAKPAQWTAEAAAELGQRVKALRGVTVVRHPRGSLAGTGSSGRAVPAPGVAGSHLVAIAASTGGPAALATVLGGLGGVNAPVLVIQHIHPDFVSGLVGWMRRVSAVDVRLAVHGEQLEPGVAYIGPGKIHLKVGPGLRTVLDSEPRAAHCPSADELFRSVAENAGAGAIGVVLTGMGDDGSSGLVAIHRRGGVTITQDEATSAVFGMPHAAQMAGAASLVLPLDDIAGAVVAATRGART